MKSKMIHGTVHGYKVISGTSQAAIDQRLQESEARLMAVNHLFDAISSGIVDRNVARKMVADNHLDKLLRADATVSKDKKH